MRILSSNGQNTFIPSYMIRIFKVNDLGTRSSRSKTSSGITAKVAVEEDDII